MTGVQCVAGLMLPAGWCLESCPKAFAREDTGAGCSLDVEVLFLGEP